MAWVCVRFLYCPQYRPTDIGIGTHDVCLSLSYFFCLSICLCLFFSHTQAKLPEMLPRLYVPLPQLLVVWRLTQVTRRPVTPCWTVPATPWTSRPTSSRRLRGPSPSLETLTASRDWPRSVVCLISYPWLPVPESGHEQPRPIRKTHHFEHTVLVI